VKSGAGPDSGVPGSTNRLPASALGFDGPLLDDSWIALTTATSSAATATQGSNRRVNLGRSRVGIADKYAALGPGGRRAAI
jgi:hypothetical protein